MTAHTWPLTQYTVTQGHSFADDTKILKVIAEPSDSTILQDDLNRLNTWSDNWLLRFHSDKCKVMTIGKRTKPKYQLCKTTLQQADKEKDIGVTIEKNRKHISDKENKANSMLSLLRRTFRHMETSFSHPCIRP